MKKYERIFVIVLDSLGIGAMPDSEKFGDVGVDTFGHILDKMGFTMILGFSLTNDCFKLSMTCSL